MNITDVLTDEDKQSILSQRIKAWAADAYGHELNKEALLAADPEADTVQIDEAITTLQTAYDTTKLKLDTVTASIEAAPAKAPSSK
jgi:hypothetical protein